MAIDTFGIPNVDTTSPDYDPEVQFTQRFERLRQLADPDALITGFHGEYLGSLASFATSAIRAGIDMSRKYNQPIEAFLSTTAIDIISHAIDAALTNPEIRQGIIRAEKLKQQIESSKNV